MLGFKNAFEAKRPPHLKQSCVCVLSCLSHVWLFATLQTVACQVSLSMGFSRKEYCSGLACPHPGDCSPPGSSVHGILQARILQWVAMPSSRGSSKPRDWTCISYISCIGREIYYQYHIGSPRYWPIIFLILSDFGIRWWWPPITILGIFLLPPVGRVWEESV